METETATDDWPELAPDPFADPPKGRFRPWRWLPLVLGLIAFELTFNPMVGVALACLKFGEGDFATALWLRGQDPNRPRGRTCAWFHLSWGFAKIGMMGFLAMILTCLLIVVAEAMLMIPVRGLLVQIQGAVLTAMAAIAAFLVSSYVALAWALAGRVKVWVSPTNHRAREARAWPPVPEVAPNPGENRVMAVVALAAILTLLTLFLLAAILARPLGLLPGRANEQVFLRVASFAMILGLIGSLAMLVALSPRLAARSPVHCWPEGEPSDAADGTPDRSARHDRDRSCETRQEAV